MPSARSSNAVFVTLALTVAGSACGSKTSDSPSTPGVATAGTAGKASAGASGVAGSAGASGSATAGSAGSATAGTGGSGDGGGGGTSGTGGTGGTGGTAGNNGGAAGDSGTAGTSGAAGTAGKGGTGGTGGKGGTSGTSGVAGTAGKGGASGGAGAPATDTVVGPWGIAAWDALGATDKQAVKTARSFFLHQSVGGDLEDGAEAVGYKFEWVASGSVGLAPGLNGGLFDSSNGNYTGKCTEFQQMAIANAATARVAIMKLGYADVLAGTLTGAQTAYLAAVTQVKASGVRVLHVTPPLVYDAPEDNAPKLQMRQWMLTTFAGDVIFDLEDLESTHPTTGARCERGGSWEICDAVRSTAACPSQNQGIDAPSGQGHLCQKQAERLARAFLYAISRAAK
ncbi:MAG: hypothetical protein IT374_19695 [Polyangiaceae bacterium]|nr:hypothetical protein [Polyangiaceae bacterium]